jgi:hypothetical protein
MPAKSKTLSKQPAAAPAKDNSQEKIAALEKKIAALESQLSKLEALCSATSAAPASSKDEDLREQLREYFSSVRSTKIATVYPKV